MTRHGDRGSTIPLVLGFFLVALLAVGGSVALADAFVQQRDLQDLCDGAASAAAASQLDLSRGVAPRDGPAPFREPARIEAAVRAYLARDAERRTVRVRATLSPDRTTLTLYCSQRRTLAFGALFGDPAMTHTATSSARAPVG